MDNDVCLCHLVELCIVWILLRCLCARDVSVLCPSLVLGVKKGRGGVPWCQGSVLTPPIGCPPSSGHRVTDTLGLVEASGVPLQAAPLSWCVAAMASIFVFTVRKIRLPLKSGNKVIA